MNSPAVIVRGDHDDQSKTPPPAAPEQGKRRIAEYLATTAATGVVTWL